LGLLTEVALLAATFLGCGFCLLEPSWWRRVIVGLGFPLSLALSGVLAVPPWAWLLPLALLLLIYPLNAWRDAPLFPTPANALNELASCAPLPVDALALDAGCGLGDGLISLRQAYPRVQFHGLEWSWPLRALCALRCPWARIRRGDIWRADWSPYALVYLFQRPESMARAAAKARAQLKPGAWLVSLEFEATGLESQASLRSADGRPVWLYRAPFVVRQDLATTATAIAAAHAGALSPRPIVVRHADDSVFGFKSEETARRFLTAMKERLAKFGLTLNATKTRLIEFGRFAAINRKRRGQGKSETFDFLGFTHCCGTDRQGRFQVTRLTVKKRM
jgi:hypothetical protein